MGILGRRIGRTVMAVVVVLSAGSIPARAASETLLPPYDSTYSSQSCYDTLVGPYDDFATGPIAGECTNHLTATTDTGSIEGTFAAVSIVGDPAGGFVTGRSETGLVLHHALTEAVTAVLYTVNVHVDRLAASCTGLFLPLEGCTTGGYSEGLLFLAMQHTECSTCTTGSPYGVRLVQSDPNFAIFTPLERENEDLSFRFVMTNASESGAPVPPGSVEIRAGLGGWASSGITGHSFVEGAITLSSIEVRTS